MTAQVGRRPKRVYQILGYTRRPDTGARLDKVFEVKRSKMLSSLANESSLIKW